MRTAYRITDAGSIEDLQLRSDLSLVTDGQDTQHVRDHLPLKVWDAFKDQVGDLTDYSFFVKAEGGDYAEIYAFHGTVPSLGKLVYRIEVTDARPGAPRWVLDQLIAEEIDNLHKVMDNILDEKIISLEEYDYHGNERDLELIHEFDGEYFESITIHPEFINEYGTPQYIVTIDYYNQDCEVETPEAIIQDESYGYKPPTQKKLDSIEAKAQRDLENHTKNGYKLELHGSNENLRVEPIILERTCYNNITHEHIYKATRTLFITRNPTHIKPLIQLRTLHQ